MPTGGISLPTGSAGSEIDLLNSNAALGLNTGSTLTTGGVSGKGTPFQQAALKQFVQGATANVNAYNKAAGVKGDTSGSTAAILEQANAMLGQFSAQDIQMGSGFLQASIQAATTGQELKNAEDQRFANALMAAAEVVGFIYFGPLMAAAGGAAMKGLSQN